MRKVGITGGIGTGKSIVSRVFGLLGIPVYDSDSAAKMLMNTLPELKEQICDVFGPEAYAADGTLNRAHLSAQAFTNPDKLQRLNALVHPQVGLHFENWAQQQQAPYVLKEAALIFEAGVDKTLDQVISVLAPKELRLKRLRLRDPHRSLADLEAIMAKQLPEEEHRRRAHFLIYNNDKQLVIPQVLNLHEQLLRLYRQSVNGFSPFNSGKSR